MNPLVYIGILVFASCSCTKKSPGSEVTKRSTFVDEPAVALMSEDEAYRLLRDTIIPIVDWPEQSIVDRLTLIEREASKVGLSVEMSPNLRSRRMTYPGLRVRNVPLVVVIKANLDSTILRVRIKDSGVLFFYLASEERSSPVPREANAPFATK
jgi:hypothetical protein